ALREPEVLLHGQAGEDVAVVRDVADVALHDPVRRERLDLVAAVDDPPAPADQAEDGADRRRLADTVAAEQRGDAAVGDVEGDSLEDVRLAEVDVQVFDREQGRRRLERNSGAHSSSPRYAPCTVGSAMIAAGVSTASREPWCMTAIRWTRPVTTSMWCST